MDIYDIIEEEYASYVFRNKTLNTLGTFLFESRKINDEVNELTNKISDYIMQNPSVELQTGTNGKMYFKYLPKFDIGTNYFMLYPNIIIKIILSDKKGKSDSSISPSSKEVPFKNNKLNNPTIIIRHTNTRPVIDKTLLENALSHEIMHGYRMLEIYLRNEKDNGNRDVKRQKLYNNISDFTNDDEFVHLIKTSYYITDIDEINANAASEAHYILSNKNIHFYNYKEYLNKIPFYDKINEIRNNINLIKNLIANNEENKKIFGQIISLVIYQGKYENNPLIAFNKLYNRLQRTYTYCIRRFYDILWSALDKDNRDRVSPIYQNKMTQEELHRELLKLLKESKRNVKKK